MFDNFENLFSSQGLSLDRLKNFLAFADAKTIVRAAAGDLVRQSLISRQIRELSEFFGVDLVKRSGRGLLLTEAGSQLARLVREQFSALSEFALHARTQPSKLRVVALNSVAIWMLLPRLTEIRKRLVNHELILQHESTSEIIQGVLEGRHDLGFVRDKPLPPALGRKSLANAGYALFVPAALWKRNRSLLDGGWLQLPLALPIGGVLRAAVDQLAQKHGISLKPALTCDSYVQAAAAVESGACAALLPLIAQPAMHTHGVQMLPVPELSLRGQRLYLIWSKRAVSTRSSVAEALAVLTELLAPGT